LKELIRNNSEIPDHLKFIINLAKNLILPKKIILFGSRARGDHRPDSDFDIAFVNIQKKHWAEFVLKIKEDTPSLYKYDCIHFDSIDEDFKNKILTEGIVLYEKR